MSLNVNKQLVPYLVSERRSSMPTGDEFKVIAEFIGPDAEAFSPSDFVVKTYRMCHDAKDRDGERIPLEIIESWLLPTAVGKSFLLDHAAWSAGQGSAIGKCFDARLEKMSPEAFEKLTGKTPVLPAGVNEVTWLVIDVYMARAGMDAHTLTRILTKVLDFVSISFGVDKRVPVVDGFGKTLFVEFRGEAEVYEFSYVFLGAQQGAAAKGLGPGEPIQSTVVSEGGEDMSMLKMLGALTGKTFADEAEVTKYVQELIAEKARLEAEAKKLTADAEMGRKYVTSLSERYATAKAVLGELGSDTPEARKTFIEGLADVPVTFLEAEVSACEKRVAEKLGGGSQVTGTAPTYTKGVPAGSDRAVATKDGGLMAAVKRLYPGGAQ